MGSDVVVKLIAADDHTRLDREIALAPGAAPGMGLRGVSEQDALVLARQAIQRLKALHAWTPRRLPDRSSPRSSTTVGSPAGTRSSP
ncbi:hypothetical protein [Lentzea sp. HUAS12]|uniref:hypothetical protein n=1 Tax=Lentzea sp. HUAS12 TaxID=2951806 RepID=UPI0035325B81